MQLTMPLDTAELEQNLYQMIPVHARSVSMSKEGSSEERALSTGSTMRVTAGGITMALWACLRCKPQSALAQPSAPKTSDLSLRTGQSCHPSHQGGSGNHVED